MLALGAARFKVFNEAVTVVEVRLLGPLEVDVDGRILDVRRQKQRALLALLALRAGEVVPTDRLIDELWGDEPPKTAVGSLQNFVSELRKMLGAEVLVTRSPGYLLDIPRDVVDVHRFERIVREAGREPPEQRAESLREALGLWRGPALADVQLEDAMMAEAARLEESRVAAWEDRLEAELELGRQSQVIGELESLVAKHPLRERPVGLLMLALYRGGRQVDALDAYRRSRERLVDELGIDPSHELQRLEQAILRHDKELDLPEAPRKRVPASEPDRRKTVTILFADLVDSTELGARLDPEVLRRVLDRYFELVRAAIERHGGVVEKFIGDAAMAVFGIPAVHEDDALRAVRAACELREALAEPSEEVTGTHGIPLQVRVGVNTGEVLVRAADSGESFATGAAVNIAARLEQAAIPGEILIGEATYRLVQHSVESEPVDPVDLGGALGRASVFRVGGVGEAARPLGRAALVGREDELAWLQAAFAGVQAERRSRVVTVLGEPGVGKSRLAREFAVSVGELPLVGRCVSYGDGATFLPLAQIVRKALPERPRAAILALLEGDDQASLVAERVTHLTEPADGAASTGEVFWATRRFLEALARQRPLWWSSRTSTGPSPPSSTLSRPSTQAGRRLLLVCLARAELLERAPGLGRRVQRRSGRAGPAGRGRAGALRGGSLAGDARGQRAAQIVEVAAGNPLFLEQLAASSASSTGPGRARSRSADHPGAARRPPRAARPGRAGADCSGPPSSAGTSRRDGLAELLPPRPAPLGAPPADACPPGAWSSGAVRARRPGPVPFPPPAGPRRRLPGRRSRTGPSCTSASAAGSSNEAGPRTRSSATTSSRHIDTARNSTPAILASSALLSAQVGVLAAAGIGAWKRADARAAANLLGRAASLLPAGEAKRAEILCELGMTLSQLGDSAAADVAFTQSIDEAGAAGDDVSAAWSRIELARARLHRGGDPEELVALVQAATPLFEEAENERAMGRAWRALGYARGSLQGRCADWLDASERALPHYRRSGWSTAGCLSETASALYHGPTPVPEALEMCERLLEEATDRLGTAHVLAFLAALHACDGRGDEAIRLLDEADNVYRDLQDDYSLANTSGRIRGRVHAVAEEHEAAQAAFRACCETFGRFDDSAALASVAAELGGSLSAQGRIEEAREWSALAERRAPAGDVIAQLSWRILKARLLAHDNRLAEAEPLAIEALSLAMQTDALTHQGDVLLDVATVLTAAKRTGEAVDRVRQAIDVYDRKQNVAAARNARARLAGAEVV